MRRPSPALVVALLALFVALGGPARAAHLIRGSEIKRNTITSRQIKNHSLSTKDLSRRAVRSLRITPAGSITEVKLANSAVTSAKLGGAAVTGAKIAAGAVGPIQIADGSLSTADIARFAERFTVSVPAIMPGTCWSGEPLGLAPERAHADISGDFVQVTPGAVWDDKRLTLSSRIAQDGQHFVISICNVATATPADTPAGVYDFRYVVLHIP
jgi:hypothetical protein